LLSSTVCSSKSFAGAGAGAGANATTARCMAACMELLAWTQPSLKRRAIQLDEGDLINAEMNGHETMELLVLCWAN